MKRCLLLLSVCLSLLCGDQIFAAQQAEAAVDAGNDQITADKKKHAELLMPGLMGRELLIKDVEDIKKEAIEKYPEIAKSLEVGIRTQPKGMLENKTLSGIGYYANGSDQRKKGAQAAFDVASDMASEICKKLITEYGKLGSYESYVEILEIMGKIRYIIQKNAVGGNGYYEEFGRFKEDGKCIEDVIIEKLRGEIKEFMKRLAEGPEEKIAQWPKREIERREEKIHETKYIEDNELGGRMWRFIRKNDGEYDRVIISHERASEASKRAQYEALKSAFEAGSEEEVKANILKFIHRISCSSTYCRGQAAITLWIAVGLARAKGYELKLAGRWKRENGEFPYDVCALLTLGEDEFVEKYRGEIQLIRTGVQS